MANRKERVSSGPLPAAGDQTKRPTSKSQDQKPGILLDDLAYIDHDDLGNAVWTVRPKIPGVADNDPTLDPIECLDVEGLAVEDDDEASNPDGRNPYDRG